MILTPVLQKTLDRRLLKNSEIDRHGKLGQFGLVLLMGNVSINQVDCTKGVGMDQDIVKDVLAEFGKRIGMPQIDFSNEGYCVLSFNDIIVNMELPMSGDHLICHAWVTGIEEDRRAEVALQLADANYLFLGTNGATLGMSRHTGDVMASIQIRSATLTLDRFEYLLESLLSLTESWQSKLAIGSCSARSHEQGGERRFA
ncbi:type III secretion system chaperone [Chitinimonas arctica]|uniref:Type III secretion system chaperone n=1 Tax=Chitinimonas arctica TaxID=2594795 RepID=A0A516S9M5_9NEIS|nr:type III secretion system chaperone [Chitinimonas arctica]QDQ24862.1 type III secretion system chaperone [Chitinimonas arctica]